MEENWGSFNSTDNNTATFTNTSLDIDYLKKEVGQRFPFYDMRSSRDTAAFYVRFDKEVLEEKFNSLRKTLSEKDYIPMLRFEGGEHIIYVIKKRKKKEKSPWINYALIIAALITTTLTGAVINMDYFSLLDLPNILEVFTPKNIVSGALFFAFPLMAILVIHEMGHYYISKKHGISTSLPFFLPIPPVIPNFNIGTFGALISSRDPMPNKKALFDVGFSGPAVGFLVALPVTIIGIMTSDIVPIEQISQQEIVFGTSLLFYFLTELLLDIPQNFVLNMNLTAFAGWVGLLITSINLLPAGQLDGGHIFRSFLGEKQKYAGWLAIFIMIFTGWLFFALIIVFMMGMKHPPPLNDATNLDNKRKLLFFAALIILILCFIPFPIYTYQ